MEDSRQGDGQSWQEVLSEGSSGLAGLQISKQLSARATVKSDLCRSRRAPKHGDPGARLGPGMSGLLYKV